LSALFAGMQHVPDAGLQADVWLSVVQSVQAPVRPHVSFAVPGAHIPPPVQQPPLQVRPPAQDVEHAPVVGLQASFAGQSVDA